MSHFGAHEYYRMQVDAFSGETYYSLRKLFPLIHGMLVYPTDIPSFSSYTYQDKKRIPLEQQGLVRELGAENVTRTASSYNTEFQDATNPSMEVSGNIDSSDTDITYDFQFPSPQYVPVWWIRGEFIDDISFYYSDNGTDWNLIITLASMTLPSSIYDNLQIQIGDAWLPRPISDAYAYPEVLLMQKGIRDTYRMEGSVIHKQIKDTYILVNDPPALYAASLGDVEYRLSGGSANTDPEDSIGGAISLQSISSQLLKPIDTLTGFTLRSGSNNTRGIGVIRLIINDNGDKKLRWTPSGGVLGGTISIPYSGRFSLLSGAGAVEGYVSVDVTYDNLPDEETEWRVWIENGDQQLLPDVAAAEAGTGETIYRCFYLYNASSSGVLGSLKLFLLLDTYSRSDIHIGVDPIGIAGEAVTIADQYTAPVGVSFSQPTEESPLVVGDIEGSEWIPIWIRRTIPAGTYEDVKHDLSIIGYGAVL